MNKVWIKIGMILFFLASFTLILGNIYRIISTTAPDFKILWVSAKDFISAKNPYTDPALFIPNAYPPVSELFYIPFALLPYQVSQALFVLISFSSIVGAIYLSIKISSKSVSPPYFLAFMGLTFLSFPIKFSLGMGQINPFVLFLLLLAYLFESKNKSILSGVALGLSIILKPTFLIFMLFFILKKSWKTVFYCLGTIILLVAITLIFWNPNIWISWFTTGILPLANLSGREAYVNQGLMGFISRIFQSIEIRKYLTGIISILFVALASFFTLMKKNSSLVLSLFIITLLFIDSASWQHHFVWLIFPFIILVEQTIKSKNIILLSFILIAYLLASWNFKNPSLYPAIILSNQFYGAFILWVINIYFLINTQSKTTKTDKRRGRHKIFELLNFL